MSKLKKNLNGQLWLSQLNELLLGYCNVYIHIATMCVCCAIYSRQYVNADLRWSPNLLCYIL